MAACLAQPVRPVVTTGLRRGCSRRVQGRQSPSFRGLEQEPQIAACQRLRTAGASAVGQQVRARDAGVCGEALDAPPFAHAPSLQLEREQQARQLRLAVGGHRHIPTVRLQVVEIDRTAARGNARQRHDARMASLAQQRQQPGRQREMAQMVRPQLQFETVGGLLALGRRHHGRIVDQQVQAAVRTQHGVGEGLDRVEAGQIDGAEAHARPRRHLADLLDGGRALGGVASRHDHRGTGPCERKGHVQADAARSGDQDRAPHLGGNIRRRPACHDRYLVEGRKKSTHRLRTTSDTTQRGARRRGASSP